LQAAVKCIVLVAKQLGFKSLFLMANSELEIGIPLRWSRPFSTSLLAHCRPLDRQCDRNASDNFFSVVPNSQFFSAAREGEFDVTLLDVVFFGFFFMRFGQARAVRGRHHFIFWWRLGDDETVVVSLNPATRASGLRHLMDCPLYGRAKGIQTEDTFVLPPKSRSARPKVKGLSLS